MINKCLDSDIKIELFFELQKGLEISKNPFFKIAQKISISEIEIIKLIELFCSNNLIRRFGVVTNNRKIGFKSVLCAASVGDNEKSYVEKKLCEQPGITHCYYREHTQNLWFTLTVHELNYFDKINELREIIKPAKILVFPAIVHYKTSVIFNLGFNGGENNNASSVKKNEEIYLLNEVEKRLIKLLFNIPISDNFFEKIAKDVGMEIEEMLLILSKLKKNGVIKRIALLPYHYNLGYNINTMCVWNVSNTKIDSLGEKLASFSDITHCYERSPCSEFKFNLFAMFHADDEENAQKTYSKILALDNELKNGIKLRSLKEVKKSSFMPDF